jgi:muconate cycloisomerase
MNRRKFAKQLTVGALGAGSLLPVAKAKAQGPAPKGVSVTTPVASSNRIKSIKVERIETFKVVIPMKPGTVLSDNYAAVPEIRDSWDVFSIPKHIIKLHASNGFVGLGETQRGDNLDAPLAKNSQFLTGRNILELNLADPALGLPQRATADGFEIAIYDLLGKTLGVPVHMLLGGRFQDKVAVTYWTGERNEADLVRIARQTVEMGYKHLKFKAQFNQQKMDSIVQLVRAVDKVAPGLELTVDFNSSYPDIASFLPVAKRLEGFNLKFEDPIPTRIDWFADLREKMDVPLALTPSSAVDTMLAIKKGACDLLNIGFDMREFVKIAFIAETAGIPIWHGSGIELGIRDMSFIHAAAATRSCTIPSDTVCFLREGDLLAKPFTVKDGYIEVPREPGLGVDLDEDALRHFQVKG